MLVDGLLAPAAAVVAALAVVAVASGAVPTELAPTGVAGAPAETGRTLRSGALRSRPAFFVASALGSGSGAAVALAAAGSTAAIGGATFAVGGMIVSTGTMPPAPVFAEPPELLGNFSVKAPATTANTPAAAISACFERARSGAGTGAGVSVFRLNSDELIRLGVCEALEPSM